MKTAYRKGRRAEYLLKKELEEAGWFVVRSAGSRGVVDLVALKDDQVLLIQVQMGSYISYEKRQQLKELASRVKGKVVVAVYLCRQWKFMEVN